MSTKSASLATVVFVTALGAWSGCSSSLCSDGYRNGHAARCEAGGTATISAPAHLGLASTVGVDRGATCLDEDGGCTAQPFLVFISSPPGNNGMNPAIVVQVYLAATAGGGMYTLPLTGLETGPAVNVGVGATYYPHGLDDGPTAEALEVSGTITVVTSTPADLRASFTLALRVPSTNETISFTGTTLDATCHLDSARICLDPDASTGN